MARPRTTRTGIAAAWLIGTALALTACGGGDPEPVFADPPTTQPAESPEPTATPEPTESAEPKRETPRQFIRRWNDISRTMQVTGDTTEYLAHTRECEPCARTAKLIEGYYAAGGYVKWDGRTTKRIQQLDNNVYDIWIESAPTEYKESSTGEVQHMEGGLNKIQIVLVRENGRFFVADFSRRPL